MTHSKRAIIVATNNEGKLAEFERLLGSKFRIEGLGGLQLTMPDEGTESYRSNAEAKAEYVAKQTGRFVLGDDSGLEVSALGGQPGISSARFAGEPKSDTRNIQKLLAALEGVPTSERAARFVCWLALAGPNGLVTSVEGACVGRIGTKPRGSYGFGYDPVFVFADQRTMAELSDEEKDSVSHRGNAIRNILPNLASAIDGAAGDA